MKNLAAWLYTLNYFCIAAALATALSSCSSFRLLPQRTPEQKLQQLVSQHPELSRPDTITVRVPYEVPAVVYRTEVVPQHDTIYLQRESTQLDTLLSQLETSLDTLQKVAIRNQLQLLLLSRPVLRDTLVTEQQGVKTRTWRTGRSYQVEVTRATIKDTTTAQVGVQKWQACPPAAPLHFAWYDPAGLLWPWWAWYFIGLVCGLFLAIRLRAA